ncbi:MAG TPA: hypothetical protein VFD07_12750 [Candidatus Krumholzibacteria bacterium]|nr:hypothetical protein [Candidatus Krumholzibacteria bacterium]
MNRDRIQPITLKSVLIFPPTVRLERGKLTQFYSTVCAYKPYTQFAFLPDGARLFNDLTTQLRVASDRLAFQERIPENQSSYGVVRDYERMVEDFWKQFTPGIFFSQEVLIEAVWPLEEGLASEFIESRFLKIRRQDVASLGADCAGIGLKLVLPRHGPTKAVEVRIEPLFRDPKYLFLALSTQEVQPIQSPSAAGERVRWVEHFLGHELADLVSATIG